MRLATNIQISVNGKPYRGDVEVSGRGGTKSPETWVIRYAGRRYVPRAQKLYGIYVSLSGALKLMYYWQDISDLVPKSNPFLTLISKSEEFTGTYVPLDYRPSKA